MTDAIRIRSLRHAWPGSPPLLDIDALTLAPGETAFLAGPSGSGKSTLLSLIAGITPIQSGTIDVLGHGMDPARPKHRDRLRAEQIGVIFQMFNLLPYLSPVENVLLPLSFSSKRAKAAGAGPAQRQAEAVRLLGALGLTGAILEKPASLLSVGQQQRVAAARALIGRPGLIIADEPTSALDADNREEFLDLLCRETLHTGAALLFVSHDRALASRFDRTIDLASINGQRAAA